MTRFLSFAGAAFLCACGSSASPAPSDDATSGDSIVDVGDADAIVDVVDAFDAADAGEASTDVTDVADAAEVIPDASTDASTFGGVPVAISSGESAPHAIVVDGASVFWTNSGDGSVVTCHADGTARSAIVTGRTKTWALGLDATNVYYSDLGSGEVRSIARVGGTDAAFHGFTGEVQSIVVGAAVNVTVHDMERVEHIQKTGSVSLDESFSGSHPMGIAMEGTVTYFSNDGVGIYGAVIEISDYTRTPTSSGPLVLDLDHPSGIAVDADGVYVASTGDGRVLMLGKDATAPTSKVLSSIETSPTGLTVDATTVYWTNYDGGTVVALDKASGARRVLASGQGNPDGIAVTADALYWVNRGDGRVMKLAR